MPENPWVDTCQMLTHLFFPSPEKLETRPVKTPVNLVYLRLYCLYFLFTPNDYLVICSY